MTDTFEQLLEKVRHIRMTPAEKRAQSISWVVGQYMVDRDYTEVEEWDLTLRAAKAYDTLSERRPEFRR